MIRHSGERKLLRPSCRVEVHERPQVRGNVLIEASFSRVALVGAKLCIDLSVSVWTLTSVTLGVNAFVIPRY
jgi:hypothetical protein